MKTMKGKFLIAAILWLGLSVVPVQGEAEFDWCDDAQWQAALRGEANVNARDVGGFTALHLADYPEEARRFIELGADVNAVTEWGCSVLRHLCILGAVDSVRLVLEKKPTTDDVNALLRVVCHYGHENVARLLLQQSGADVNTVDAAVNTLLHYACGQEAAGGDTLPGQDKNRLQLIRMLLEAGLSPNARNKEGNTPLHLAAQHQAYEVIPLLLAAGADRQAKNEAGMAPVRLLRMYGVRGRDFYGAELFLNHGEDADLLLHFLDKDDVPAVRIMKNRGADVTSVSENSYGRKTPLHLSKSVDMTQLLLESGANVGAKDEWEQTPLFYARTPEMVRLLVRHGADVNATARHDRTPLNRLMIDSLYWEVAEALLEAGAELNPENAMPPLHQACVYGNLAMVEKLLSKGANLHLKSHAGKTALDYARQFGKTKIVRLLEKIQK